MNPAIVAAGIAIGLLYKVGKDATDNYKAQEIATKLLTQAYATQKDTLNAHRGALEAFLRTNKAFITNQYDVEAALAMVVRAGNNATDSFRILNDALDLSIIKQEPVSLAAKSLTLALNGNGKALKELGISTAQYSAIMKDKTLTVEQKHLALLKLIEGKTKDGRKATDDLQQSQNALNKDWQDFTAKAGPGVVGALDDIIKAADILVQLLDLTGQYLTKIGQLQGNVATHRPGDPISGPHGISPRGTGSGASPSVPTIHLHGPVTVVHSDAHAKQLSDSIRRVNRSFR